MSSCFPVTPGRDTQLSQGRKNKIWKHFVHGLQSKVLGFLDRSPRRRTTSTSSGLALHHHQASRYRLSYQEDDHDHHRKGALPSTIHRAYQYSAKSTSCIRSLEAPAATSVVVNSRVDAGFDGDDRDQKREDGNDNGRGRDRRLGLSRSASSCSTGSSSAVVQRDLMGVDAEAERFINNFYKRLNMERQESSEEEYNAMLARGC